MLYSKMYVFNNTKVSIQALHLKTSVCSIRCFRYKQTCHKIYMQPYMINNFSRHVVDGNRLENLIIIINGYASS